MNPPAGKAPTFKAKSFVCPHCGVAATHEFQPCGTMFASNRALPDPQLYRSKCHNCEHFAYWVEESLVWPRPVLGDEPNEYQPPAVRDLYEQARQIAGLSPCAAAGLLRLAVDRLAQNLEAKGKDFDKRIAALAEMGLAASVIKSMDAVRLTGNKALHEGQIAPDGTDDAHTVELLFAIVNDITRQLIEGPEQLKALHQGKPERDL